jgi:hypothetical protein
LYFGLFPTTGYLLNNRKYHGDGIWFAPPDGSPSMDMDYYPNGCTFTQRLSSKKELHQCFRKNNMTRMLVTGDSHTVLLFKYLEAFPRALNSTERCRKAGYSAGDPVYFIVPNVTEEMIKIVSLRNYRVKCPLNDNFNYQLERIAMVHLLDGSLGIQSDNILKENIYKHVLFAETRLEYLLKYYFPHVGFPDIWFYYVTFHHDCWGNRVDKIKADLSYLFDLMYIYLPTTTTVVFIADARECAERSPPEVAQEFKAFWNTTRNHCIHEMNQALFEVFWEKAPRSKNFYAFLDAGKIACPIQCTWHKDGAHMIPLFYSKMATYLLESYCAGTQ